MSDRPSRRCPNCGGRQVRAKKPCMYGYIWVCYSCDRRDVKDEHRPEAGWTRVFVRNDRPRDWFDV